MTKLLKEALALLRSLPEDEQERAAAALIALPQGRENEMLDAQKEGR